MKRYDGFSFSFDLLTDCKSASTALRRFEEKYRVFPPVAGKIPWMLCGIKDGQFCQSRRHADGMDFYKIEDRGNGSWYVYLSASGVWEGGAA